MALYIFSVHILSVCCKHINLRFKISPPLSPPPEMYVRSTSYTVPVVSVSLARVL